MDRDQLALAILNRTIEIHPAKLNLEELIRELCGENADAEGAAAVEQAVEDLRRVKLIHPGELVEPTRASFRFHQLLGP